eukprot:CAMPEP_0196734950 /NCGR_PEP_ID=MMETSP1091-20130531/13531_1 /TAXON_ID=302021 /ORGANISM="Rhodomonas sp., Strain CCMP768" /LENGTH=85 /DNA_ID=CAMNT_0042078531 /DNA_START=131 /DNA_END=388 /DNA_ORIENTATION=+
MFQEAKLLKEWRQSLLSSKLESSADTKLDPREGKNNVDGSGPATHFRAAATDGVGMWGPIMGGVVAVGGTVAIIGSMLHENEAVA